MKVIEQRDFPENNLLGFISYTNQEILILCTMPRQKQWEILLHEVSHGVMEFFGIDGDFEEKAKEDICDAFSRALPMIEFEEDAA